jgi:Lipocalin-like domain
MSDSMTTKAPAAIEGTWGLLAYVVENEHGEIVDRPFGPNPHGVLIYTPGGEVAVHLMADGRQRCGFVRPVDCPPDRKLAAYDSHLSYAGTYRRTGDRVVHHVLISSHPDYAGTDLVRALSFHQSRLVLRAEPNIVRGRTRIAVLEWSRRDGGR